MKKASIFSENRGSVILKDVEVTETFIERFQGLMMKPRMDAEALIIKPCGSIHMFFMRFSIDAVFMNGSGRILAIEKRLKPWSVSGIHRESRSVMELPAGQAEAAGFFPGEVLRIEDSGILD